MDNVDVLADRLKFQFMDCLSIFFISFNFLDLFIEIEHSLSSGFLACSWNVCLLSALYGVLDE
jgi:hypothetical protein